MNENVPPLAEWLRWLADLPEAFRAEPEAIRDGVVRTSAVVGDLFEAQFGSLPDAHFLASFRASSTSKVERNRLGWVLAACHVLAHPSLAGRTLPKERIAKFLVEELATLAPAVPVAALDSDVERREELVRRVLRAAGLVPEGESANEFDDRAKQVDSVERQRVLAAAAEREMRAREVREAMAKKAAEEAAAKVSRE